VALHKMVTYHAGTIEIQPHSKWDSNKKFCYQSLIYSPTDALVSCLKKQY